MPLVPAGTRGVYHSSRGATLVGRLCGPLFAGYGTLVSLPARGCCVPGRKHKAFPPCLGRKGLLPAVPPKLMHASARLRVRDALSDTPFPVTVEDSASTYFPRGFSRELGRELHPVSPWRRFQSRRLLPGGFRRPTFLRHRRWQYAVTHRSIPSPRLPVKASPCYSAVVL